ncbi:hypothetical protein A1O3_01857 [Capronia epimyces CBS 606.96]|uniref:Uncharacterized protein n=1 Tax=Capronia epimyces CBS 606.96 TaxID=1182542 RepID=W9Y8D0_9EURO|nr:uncharacterized protein A1O3_01857 [Capronia epimyces CBS 606.96]EXJ88793.1 hypothetical protein A1O3_01857 [Capronia epimyces CBS 606.96]
MAFSCLCFARPKEPVDRTSQAPRNHKREECESETSGAQRNTKEMARAESEKATSSWEQAQKYKTDKKSRKAEEKRTLNYYSGGLARGFDPNAGMVRSGRDCPSVAIGTRMSVNNVESAPDSTDQRPVRGQTWGVQFGNPSNHVRLGHEDSQGTSSKHRQSDDVAG